MIYNFPSCRLDDPKAVKRLLNTFLKSKMWGLFSFQPNTMTAIEESDVKVLKKYEPFGLVIYKMGDVIAIPAYINDTYYDLYKNIVDLLKKDWILYGNNYYIKPSSMILNIKDT